MFFDLLISYLSVKALIIYKIVKLLVHSLCFRGNMVKLGYHYPTGKCKNRLHYQPIPYLRVIYRLLEDLSRAYLLELRNNVIETIDDGYIVFQGLDGQLLHLHSMND